jgi:hypothetical protein
VISRSGIHRIIAECLDNSVASLKVLGKLGMKRVDSAGGKLRFELQEG